MPGAGLTADRPSIWEDRKRKGREARKPGSYEAKKVVCCELPSLQASQLSSAFNLFYMHPWEIDPEQPRVKRLSIGRRFRHYANLERTEDKLRRMIEALCDYRFVHCSEYLDLQDGS